MGDLVGQTWDLDAPGYSVFARPGGAGSTGIPSCDLSFFCTSTSPTSSAGDGRRHRHHAALGAAHAVEGLPLAAGGEDAAEGRQRRADQIDAAHQLHRPIVGIDAVDDVRQHVERVRNHAAGEGEAAFDVLEEEAERAALLLDLALQPRHQLVERHRLAGIDDQVRLARYRRKSGHGAAVPVRLDDAGDRRPAHEERLQHAAIHRHDAPRFHAFVIVGIVADQLRGAVPVDRRIEGDAQELRQHLLVQPLGEGLRVVDLLGPVPLDAMAEDLVEEDASGAARQDRRAGIRIDHRRRSQRLEEADHLADVRDELRLGRQAFRRPGEVGTIERQLHAVLGLGRRRDHQPRRRVAGDDLRALGADEVAPRGVHREGGIGREHERLFAERRGDAAQPPFPGGDVGRRRPGRLAEGLRRLAREVGDVDAVLHLRRDVRLDLGEALDRLLELAIRGPPEDGPDRVGRLALRTGQRQRGPAEAAEPAHHVAADLAGVVERVVADADVDDGAPAPLLVSADERPERGSHEGRLQVIDGVAGEVRGRASRLRPSTLRRSSSARIGRSGSAADAAAGRVCPAIRASDGSRTRRPRTAQPACDSRRRGRRDRPARRRMASPAWTKGVVGRLACCKTPGGQILNAGSATAPRGRTRGARRWHSLTSPARRATSLAGVP